MPRKKIQPPSADDAAASTPALGDEEKRRLVEDAIAKAEKLAESQIEMVKLFLARGKVEIARRRLQEVLEKFPQSESASIAKQMLRRLKRSA